MKVFLSVPGPSISPGSLRGACLATDGRHEIEILLGSAAWDGFNGPWIDVLNQSKQGDGTHFAMLHSDISPDPGWLDVLMSEMEQLEADLISVIVPLKDDRGICSCGIGNPHNSWAPLKRLTMTEVMALPETINAYDLGYPGYALLHNNGCWLADLRRPIFHETDREGRLLAYFNFPREVRRGPDGLFKVVGESEDWFFSRQLHYLKAKTYLTRKVILGHAGICLFPNNKVWGTNATDVESVQDVKK